MVARKDKVTFKSRALRTNSAYALRNGEFYLGSALSKNEEKFDRGRMPSTRVERVTFPLQVERATTTPTRQSSRVRRGKRGERVGIGHSLEH